MGGSATQKSKSGDADMPMWAMMASISTLVVSVLITVKSGMIEGWVLGIVVAVNILSGLWLFFSRGRGEF